MTRLISVNLIPSSLWNKDKNALYLPPQLVSGWEMLLDKYQLRDMAMQKAPKGFEGGMSQEDTNKHLAWRFTGSSARVMLTMLDPLDQLPRIPDIFVRVFSGNRVFLADLPCGSGAVSLSILSVLCELRKQKRIPRMPLHVVILGGEISQYAQSYAKEALEFLRIELATQAITIEFDIIDWDVCDRFINTNLIQRLTLKSQNCSAKLLILANFSGFLEREKKFKLAQSQLDELFRYSQSDNSIALWIEPQKSNVTKSFFLRLINWFKKQFSILLKDQVLNSDSYAKSSARAINPLTENMFRVGLAVIRFDLPERSHS